MMSMSSIDFPIRYLSPSEVLRVARAIVDTDDVDREALYMAVRRTAEGDPAAFEGRIHEFAASLLEGLVSFRPFTVDNDEVALLAVARFYAINGWALDIDDEVGQLVLDISAGRASVFAGAALLARHAHRTG